jgi:hypothetical protein
LTRRKRNGRNWLPAPHDPEETDQVIRASREREVIEAEFRDWIAARCG